MDAQEFVYNMNVGMLTFWVGVAMIVGYFKLLEFLSSIGDGSWGLIAFMCTPVAIMLLGIGLAICGSVMSETETEMTGRERRALKHGEKCEMFRYGEMVGGSEYERIKKQLHELDKRQ